MPSPRDIALGENDRSKFDTEPNDDQINPKAREEDYRANPKNPPDGPPPAK